MVGSSRPAGFPNGDGQDDCGSSNCYCKTGWDGLRDSDSNGKTGWEDATQRKTSNRDVFILPILPSCFLQFLSLQVKAGWEDWEDNSDSKRLWAQRSAASSSSRRTDLELRGVHPGRQSSHPVVQLQVPILVTVPSSTRYPVTTG